MKKISSKTPASLGYRMPAEWETHQATWLVWPHHQPDWPGKLACVGGVAVGTGGWFTGLSWMVSLGHGKLSEKTLLRMEHYSGAFLLIVALIQGGVLFWQLCHKG